MRQSHIKLQKLAHHTAITLSSSSIIHVTASIKLFCDKHALNFVVFLLCFSASHVRDILRKSYGDEGPSGLGSEAVLTVPEG